MNIDKEFLRLWFREHCDPYADEVPCPPHCYNLKGVECSLADVFTSKPYCLYT